MSLDGKGIFPADEGVPRQSARAFKQFVERLGVKSADADIHALSVAQKNVCKSNTLRVCGKGNAPVDRGDPLVTERFDLLAEQMFQSEEAGGNQL